MGFLSIRPTNSLLPTLAAIKYRPQWGRFEPHLFAYSYDIQHTPFVVCTNPFWQVAVSRTTRDFRVRHPFSLQLLKKPIFLSRCPCSKSLSFPVGRKKQDLSCNDIEREDVPNVADRESSRWRLQKCRHRAFFGTLNDFEQGHSSGISRQWVHAKVSRDFAFKGKLLLCVAQRSSEMFVRLRFARRSWHGGGGGVMKVLDLS